MQIKNKKAKLYYFQLAPDSFYKHGFTLIVYKQEPMHMCVAVLSLRVDCESSHFHITAHSSFQPIECLVLLSRLRELPGQQRQSLLKSI